MNKRIAVTGGLGFVGSNLVERLLKEGNQVVILDSFVKHLSEKALERVEGAEIIRGDVRKFYDVEQIGQVDGIFHLAANSNIDISVKSPLMDFEVNALGTVNMLEYARRHGHVPIIFSSSARVYDALKLEQLGVEELDTRFDFEDLKYKEAGIPIDFPMNTGLRTPYGASKTAADSYCQEYARTFDLPATVFRFGPISGPWQIGVEEAGWMTWFCISLLSTGKITIYGNGKQVRDTLNVNDVCDLLLHSMKHSHRYKGSVFNVGGGYKRSTSLLEAVNFMEDQKGKKFSIRWDDWKKGDIKVYYSDIKPLKDFWVPKYTPKDTITQILDWLEENPKVLALYKKRLV